MQRVFQRVFLHLDAINGNLIQWILNPGFPLLYPFDFSVQASATVDFSEILYTIEASTNFYVRDTSNFKQSWSHSFYYRVVLTDANGNTYYSETLQFDSAPTTARKYRMAAEIMRKNNVLAKFIGYTGFLLKRKYQGQIDVQNVNPVTGEVLSTSPTGYGTGIVGGYYNPIPMFFNVVQSAEARQISSDGVGTKESLQEIVQSQGFPVIEEKDIIVKSGNNQRFSVDGVSRTYFPGTEICVIQKLTMFLVPIEDVIYEYPLPCVPPDLTPANFQPLP